MGALSGGEALQRRLDEIAKKLKSAATLRVGFLENATYPDGTPVAMVAAVNEFGAPSRGQPPRPFFRNAIRDHAPEWPDQIEALVASTDYDAATVLGQMGEMIAGEIRQSITDTNEPPLAPSTIKRKGHEKPLVDSGVMLGSVDYEVE